MSKVRVNIATTNKAKVRKEKIDGREKIIVSSATLPFGVVMNGIRYPGEEIEKTYMGLNDTIAPIGHPKVNGQYVSALSPDGLAVGYIGAHNTNVRLENDRVLLDKVIDVKRAEESEDGRRLLNAIEAGDPIHTSTGLVCNLRDIDEDGVKQEAFNMVWDHDAILLDEPGAAGPDQGVGMMVNAAKDVKGNELNVINSTVEMFDMEIDHLGQAIVGAIERREQAGRWDRIKDAVIRVIMGDSEIVNNAKEDDDMSEVSREDFDKLSADVKALTDGMSDQITNAVKAAIAPLSEEIGEVKTAVNADAEAKRADLIKQVVSNGQLPEEAAKNTPTEALEALANMKTGDAHGIGNGQEPGQGSERKLSPLAVVGGE